MQRTKSNAYRRRFGYVIVCGKEGCHIGGRKRRKGVTKDLAEQGLINESG